MDIKEELDYGNPLMNELERLSSQYYSHIPHDFGTYSKGYRPVSPIKDDRTLKEEAKLLESLDYITSAIKLHNSHKEGAHPITTFYQNLKCDLRLANTKDFEFIRNGFRYFYIYYSTWVII